MGGQFAPGERAQEINPDKTLTLGDNPTTQIDGIVPLPRLLPVEVQRAIEDGPDAVKDLVRATERAIRTNDADRLSAGRYLKRYTQVYLEDISLGTSEALQYADKATPSVKALEASEKQLRDAAAELQKEGHSESANRLVDTADEEEKLLRTIKEILAEIRLPEKTQDDREAVWDELRTSHRMLARAGMQVESWSVQLMLNYISWLRPSHSFQSYCDPHLWDALKEGCVFCGKHYERLPPKIKTSDDNMDSRSAWLSGKGATVI